MTAPGEKCRTRRNAMELTLHRLRNPLEPPTYEESIYGTIVRLSEPDPVGGLIDLAIVFADVMATFMEGECGSREAAIKSLERQITESDAETS